MAWQRDNFDRPSACPTINNKLGLSGYGRFSRSPVQERLKNLGFFKDTVDGIFGEVTEVAVKTAQQKLKIPPDGIVGSATWSALLR